MTSRNPTENDGKSLSSPKHDPAPNKAEPSERKQELTDDEIAKVTGGTGWIETTGASFR
jgi:hypothetical protein